mgnify:CR=1 FL=1
MGPGGDGQVLTIKQFSRITAIPESTLRYYDAQGILRPRGRGENGYRLYEADQILPAKFLCSLRLASVPVEAVRAYQHGDAQQQQEALSRWYDELGERIAWLELARKYIESLRRGGSAVVTLQVVPPERVVWFVHDGPVGGFAEHYDRRQRELAASGLALHDAYFQHVADLEPGMVRGKVGFTVTGRAARLPEGGELEERPSLLTLSLEHRAPMAEIRSTYARLHAFVAEHGWQAVGPALERYPVGPPDLYAEVLIPILRLER